MEVEKKNNKKLLIGIIILIVVLAIVSGLFIFLGKKSNNDEETKEESVVKEQITPLMYEITKEGSNNKIYLFGSIHLTNKKEFDYPQYVMDAYKNSDYLAVEIDLSKSLNDSDAIQVQLEKMMYKDGTKIKDHISEETYNKLVETLKAKGFYNEMLEVYNTYFFETLLTELIYSDAGINSEEGVDIYFINMANEDKKTVLEVESEEFQFNLLLGFPERIYELSIISILDEYDKQVEAIKELYTAWKNGDPKEIERLANEEESLEELDESDIELVNDYNKKLLTDRNYGMKDKLEEYFENDQHVLFIVGAAHLVGDEGIANLLSNDGYIVKQINK